MKSLSSVVCRLTLWTSTIGDSAVTTIVSSSVPTFMSPLMTATNDPLNSMLSRRTVLKPASENVTEYTPARRSTMRYDPSALVTAVRVFSMSDGLEASTVTPGRTAPEASLTTPVRLACARATDGTSSSNPIITHTARHERMNTPFGYILLIRDADLGPVVAPGRSVAPGFYGCCGALSTESSVGRGHRRLGCFPCLRRSGGRLVSRSPSRPDTPAAVAGLARGC